MKFKKFYSGSSENLYVLTAANGKRLLIECGVTWSKLRKSLDFDLSRFEGCFCSHLHKDHSKAIADVMLAGIDVFASHYTLNTTEQDHHRANVIEAGQTIKLDTFQVYAFDVFHDVPALGFVIKCDNEYLLFATDTSHITNKFPYQFDIIAIECSFDKHILQKRVDDKDIHESLAKRLWGSHMEKDNTLAYVRDKCDLSKCRELHLLHMSGDNIEKHKTRKEFEEELFIPTFI